MVRSTSLLSDRFMPLSLTACFMSSTALSRPRPGGIAVTVATASPMILKLRSLENGNGWSGCRVLGSFHLPYI